MTNTLTNTQFKNISFIESQIFEKIKDIKFFTLNFVIFSFFWPIINSNMIIAK